MGKQRKSLSRPNPSLILTAFSVLVAIGPALAQARASQDPVVLQGLVLNREAPVPGTEVMVRGEGISETRLSDEKGRFEFRLLLGSYNVHVHLLGFYDVLVQSVQPQRNKRNELTINLTEDFSIVHDPVVEPARSPFPPLEVSVEWHRIDETAGSAAGEVRFQNNGIAKILIPVSERTADSVPPGTLLMQISIRAPFGKSKADFFQWYQCQPALNCRNLKPGESLSIPFTSTLRTRESKDGSFVVSFAEQLRGGEITQSEVLEGAFSTTLPR